MLPAHGPYAAWAAWLEAFARGEDLPSRHLTVVDEQLGPQMHERLLLRLGDAFDTRARAWADTLSRHIAATTIRRPGELGTLLVAARGRLQPLRVLASDPRLPESVRASLTDALRKSLKNSQDSLENSVRRLPQGAEPLLAVLRENTLLAALDPPSVPLGRKERRLPPPPVGRRVIL